MPPSRVRYSLVGFAVTLAIITYIDRVCISQTASSIQKEFGLSKIEMGWVFSIFAWTYGIFEIPWGWLGDRIGPRKVLMRIVMCWSFFTAATGWAWNYASLLVTRALFGAGEAGCFPNITKAFMIWLPAGERAQAQGFLWLAARWGGAFTPSLVVLVLQIVSWRNTFVLFGAIGVLWAILFYRWYRDDPRTHPRINEAELALLPNPRETGAGREPVPWGIFLSSRRVWMLLLQYFFLAYGAFFYMTRLPEYLQEVHKLQGWREALLASLPFFFAGLGSLFCGFVISRNPKARRPLAVLGFGGACSMTVLSSLITNPVGSMVVLGLAGFANDLAMPPSWSVCMEVGGRFVGTLSGCMNMMSCLGSAAFPVVSGWILEKWTKNNWNVVFFVSAGMYFLGMLCWIFLSEQEGKRERSSDR